MSVDLRLLNALLLVTERHSFHRAATQARRRHATLSRPVGRLEVPLPHTRRAHLDGAGIALEGAEGRPPARTDFR